MKKILTSTLVLAAAALTVTTTVLAVENTPAQDAFNASQGYTPEEIAAFKKYREEAIDNGYNKDQIDAIKKEAAQNGRTIDPSLDLEKQVDQVRANSADYDNIKGSTYSSTSAEETSTSSSSDNASKETKSTEVAVKEAKKAAKASAKEGQKVLPNTAAVK
ncbi:LPKTxAVK-anchored surface protein [Streptococcus sp. NLN64]|uniref:LPKTxAVK-anchored surface protein n=1 Tax=Streptococcus sp. NLN64 TaxID=2822799 RepID=UPI0018CACE62|nr:LPKTxAVK-anchored surface protein [Streptococcus sp. NLN64]MBG9367046.1 hypothetical protein [Streptococcus sp. NLN64]